MGATLIGIDFGTAVTRTVRWRSDGDWTSEIVCVPSIALAQGESLRVGRDAEALAAQHPQAVACGLKRLLERSADDEVARAVASRCSAKLTTVQARPELLLANDTRLPVEAAVAAMLHQAASQVLPEPAQGPCYAVLTTPNWYDPMQQAGLRSAAEQAGLEVLRLIDEGAALALWLARGDPSERTLALVNAGAGGVSVTLASIDPHGVYVAATASDRLRGGDDLTAALVDGVIGELASADAGSRELLRQAIEPLKIELVSRNSVEATVKLGGAGPATVTLERSDILPALNSLLGALQEACEEALDEAELAPDEVDGVYATGGMSAFPAVIERIGKTFQSEVQHGRELEQHTVLGAAFQAAVVTRRTKGPLVLDGMSTGSLSLPPPSSTNPK